jgi:hypothetical protein
MRFVVIGIVAVVAGCSGGGPDESCHYQDHTYHTGDTWPAGDGCNDCTCNAPGNIDCTARPCSAPPDANPATACLPSGTCTTGVGCGPICCGAGEQCVLGTCLCGDSPACGDGDTCESAGPVGEGGCGSICCGASGPCPQ